MMVCYGDSECCVCNLPVCPRDLSLDPTQELYAWLFSGVILKKQKVIPVCGYGERIDTPTGTFCDQAGEWHKVGRGFLLHAYCHARALEAGIEDFRVFLMTRIFDPVLEFWGMGYFNFERCTNPWVGAGCAPGEPGVPSVVQKGMQHLVRDPRWSEPNLTRINYNLNYVLTHKLHVICDGCDTDIEATAFHCVTCAKDEDYCVACWADVRAQHEGHRVTEK